MLIGQITDIHLGFEPGNPHEFNRTRLDRVLDHLYEPHNRPDMLLATGDLTDRGDAESYRRLKDAFEACPFPVWPCIGNHDLRGAFLDAFPETANADGFVQYEIDTGPLRLIVLDTLEEGRHGGAFCERRATWLSARLEEQPERPVAIVMHHPPIAVGIDWMNTHPEEPWVKRFTAAIADGPQVMAVLCGHLHRPIASAWNGRAVTICASTAPLLALDLAPLDPATPDERAMIIAEPPGYALHRWTGRGLVSHFGAVGDSAVLARFDESMQPLVASLMAERPS